MEAAFEFTAESRAKAIRLLEQDNQKEEHKRGVEEVKPRPYLHPNIWKVMRHQDGERFAGFAEAVDSQGVVPATLTEKVLLPGNASLSCAIHEHSSAQKRLAAFAQRVHSSSELQRSARFSDRASFFRSGARWSAR
jgi:hypothetical protein